MEITVISEEDNPMLHRTDVTFRVSHVEATPDRLAVRDSLAARLNKDADEVVIRRLDTKFGMRTTVGEAKVYEGPEFAKDVEQQHMLARNKIAVGEDGEVEVESAEGAVDEPVTDEPEPAEETEEAADDEPDAEESEEATDDEPDAEESEEAADDEPDAEESEEAADDEPDVEETAEEAADDEPDADEEAAEAPDADADADADEAAADAAEPEEAE